MKKLQTFWLLHFCNPVRWRGEKGGFKVKIRRFWLEVETVSGNFKARWMAGEHPYGYLVASLGQGNLDNIYGFCAMVYELSMLLTTDQTLVDDIKKVVTEYDKRLLAKEKPVEDPEEEAAALAQEQAVQEYVEKPKRQRRKIDRDVNGRFKKAEKAALAQDLQGHKEN